MLPDGLLKNKNSKYVRKWVENVAEIKAIISLPEEAFQSFGAMVKTSLCIFQKLETGKIIDNQKETLLVEIDNVGYDATGRKKVGQKLILLQLCFIRRLVGR